MEQLAVEEKEVTPEVSFADDLNADSLDLVEFITAIEEEFGYPLEEAEKKRLLKTLLIIFGPTG